MKQMLTDNEISNFVREAATLADSDYSQPEPTVKQHAKLQALQIKINAELRKTIRHLDEKNGRLQKFLLWLSLVATFATVVALLK